MKETNNLAPMSKQREYIEFMLGYKMVKVNFSDEILPTTTLLQYLRDKANKKGTKEGCNIGDCGACTVVIAEAIGNSIKYKAINSCLLLLPQIHGKQIICVEHLQINDNLHPVQQAMIDMNASQCGFCTPGFVMSMFCLYKQTDKVNIPDIQDTFAGNLCRCTGYNSIQKAAFNAFENKGPDHFDKNELNTIKTLNAISQTNGEYKNGSYIYFSPNNIKDALTLIDIDKKTMLINGSTDESIKLSKQDDIVSNIIDISCVSELDYITINSNSIHIGATTTLQELTTSIAEFYPEFNKILTVFGSKQIRNRATLSGNIAAASPIGDTLPFLLAIDTSLKINSANSERTILLKDFILGYHRTDLKSNEIISEIILPKPSSDYIYGCYKLSKRIDLDIATISIGICLKLSDNKLVEDVSVYYGGMAEITKPAISLCEFMLNKEWNESNVIVASKFIKNDFTPISDGRAEAKGRLVMAENLFIKFWTEHE